MDCASENEHQLNWISVKDRLPKEDLRVFVLVRNKPDTGDVDIYIGSYWNTDLCPSKFHLDDDDIRDTASDDRTITHWLPFEALPKLK